jgi:hypothetical protein
MVQVTMAATSLLYFQQNVFLFIWRFSTASITYRRMQGDF